MRDTALAKAEQSPSGLEAKVLHEVLPAFHASVSPGIPDQEVSAAVALLFQLLGHRVGDLELDAVGDEILSALSRWFHTGELVKLADRYEPFSKFVLRVIDPLKFAQLKSAARNRLAAAKVLKALDLLTNKELSAFESCTWDQFPPSDVRGKSDFLEHVARTYVFRNVDDHQARVLNQREKAQVAESFCVFLVWCVFKFNQQISRSLTIARFSGYLETVRTRFAVIRANYVELATETRLREENRFLDRLSPLPNGASFEKEPNASKLVEVNRVTVIEAEPGAGKTSTLQFLAWRQADGLLGGKAGYGHVPVYVELKLLSHRGQTIEAAVEQTLKSANGEAELIPWNSLLLLVDGLNEVAPEFQVDFTKEIRDLLSTFSNLRTVVAGRPNSFCCEFDAQIVVLQRLTDKQLADLFQHALEDDPKSVALLETVRLSPFLSLWTRNPFHGTMVASLAKHEGLQALTKHAPVVRRCIRNFLDREKNQASAGINRTDWETKELLLARLAFETKCVNQGVFSRISARSILAAARAKVGATSLDVSQFLEEVRDNHLLERADQDSMEFAHELYHDYFAATELEARERMQTGLGVEFAVAHFTEVHWSESVRLFADFSNTGRTLITRGAEKNPFLAWQLLRDAGDETRELVEQVADDAYCALSAEMKTAPQATMAGACIFVLADLGCIALLVKAIRGQREVFEPPVQLSNEQWERQMQVALPLASGLLSLVRLAMMEQKLEHEDRFCRAARAAIQGLVQIKAARVLTLMLSAWTGNTFDAQTLVPGLVLDALIDLGVDEVLDRGDESMNRSLAEWLRRASEAGFGKAWPAYGRVLRLARRVFVSEAGLEFDGEAALKWLLRSHDAGDSQGTLELALLMIEEPGFSGEEGEGERLLRSLALSDNNARYELGLRMLKGEDLIKNEAEGFEHLLSAAESGHANALGKVNPFHLRLLVPAPHTTLPLWANGYQDRLKALFPDFPFNLP